MPRIKNLSFWIALWRIAYCCMTITMIFLAEGWLKLYFVGDSIRNVVGIVMNFLEYKREKK